jgi:hypothetical protein
MLFVVSMHITKTDRQMIHLKKDISLLGGAVSSLVCTSNPFTKGRAVDKKTFSMTIEAGERVCKKCERIFNRTSHEHT